jgi:general secretion pathway protein D
MRARHRKRPERLTLAGVEAAFALLVSLSLSLGGCATSSEFRKGQKAEQLQNYDLAVVQYTKAIKLKPDSRDIHYALERAKLRAAESHFARGRRYTALEKYDEALVEYQLASELNPSSGDIDRELRETRNKLRARIAVAHEGKTELQTLIERARDLPPPGLDLPADVKLPDSLVFREASTRDVFISLARFADINVIFDPSFRDAPVTVDLRKTTLESALGSVASATRNFYRVTAPRTVTIVPDTPAKRREYEDEVVRTFYLSNADLKEVIDLLRVVIDLRRISPITATNAITIKDTPERVAAAARVISAIDKARPEVIIDVELLEVDRTKLKEYGLQIASGDQPGISGQVVIGDQNLTLQGLRDLSASDVFLTNFPSLFYRLLKSDSNTRILANPQLRTSEGVSAEARFGDRVPVPVTIFAPIATGGVSQQPITSFNYENIGVNIDITPRTHHDDDVTLALKVELSSISGTGFGGLPTFGNRSINTQIRLRDGETNMLAGLIRDNERTVLDGIPGLSDLPIIGPLFAHTKKEAQETDIVLTLTPHIVRVLDLSEGDLRPFKVGRDTATPIVDLPLPDQTAPPQEVPQPASATPPGVPSPDQPARPILPPRPTEPPPSQPPHE